MCISYFPHFLVLPAILQVKDCLCLIFHVFQWFSPYSMPYSECFHFPRFSIFLPYSRSYSVHFSLSTFLSVSCHKFMSYTVHFSFSPFSVFLAILQVLQSVFLIFHVFQFSRNIQGQRVFLSLFPSFSVFLSNYMSYTVNFSFSLF